MKEIVARIIDDSDFLEFKQEYDALTVWLGKMGGYILALSPIMDQSHHKERLKPHSLFIFVNKPNDHFYSCITPRVLWSERMLNKTALSNMVLS